MEAIDPELRGSEGVLKTETSSIAPAATDAHVSADSQDFTKPNIAINSSANDQGAQQPAHSGATDALPYFNTTIPEVTVPPPTYQPINFTPHEPRKRPRSCESCRGLKVKCEATAEGPCKRCLKAGRECNYTESSGRRKKKQENKVAELEKQVSGLTAALLAQRGAEASDSIVFDESLLPQNDTREADNLNGKRHRSEFEQDNDAKTGRAAKYQILSSGVAGAHGRGIDMHLLNRLAGESVLQDFCANLKSLDLWFREHIKSSKIEVKDENEAVANGKETLDTGNKDALSNDSDAKPRKSAPNAPMVRTPLDLLSQVASDKKASESGQGQDNKWYSPYAKATQDTSGYYGENKQEDEKTRKSTALPDLEQALRVEFGKRANLVTNFLNLFLAASLKDTDPEK